MMKLILYYVCGLIFVSGNRVKQFLNPPDGMVQYDMDFINRYDDSRPPEELPEEMEKKWVHNEIDESQKKK